MSVAANQIVNAQGAKGLLGHPVKNGVHIYAGTMVFIERTSGADEGYALDDDDGGANDFAGIAVDEVDNSAGSNGDLSVQVWTEGTFELQGTGFSQAIVNDLAYASDNYTVTASNSSTTKIGRFKEYVSSTRMTVKLDAVQA